MPRVQINRSNLRSSEALDFIAGSGISLTEDADSDCFDVTIAVSGNLDSGGNITMAEAKNIVLGTTTGTKIATGEDQKLGFFNVTPVIRPSAFTQTYATADKTFSAYTANDQSAAYTGSVVDSEAKLTDINLLRVAYENLRAFTEDMAGVLNSAIDDLQAFGLLK